MRTVLEAWKREFSLALEEEINWQRERGGRGYDLNNGMFLGQYGNQFLYLFSMDADYTLADDTPVRIRVGGADIHGAVISAEGFDLTVAMDEFAGARIDQATMYAAFWQLLAALQERLAAIGGEDRYNTEMALRCLVPPALESAAIQGAIPALCAGQAQARKMAGAQPLTVVWGPPGTGKTEVLAAIAAEHYRAGYRVLIAAHSNVAVDNAIARVAAHLSGDAGLAEAKIVRYGYPRLPSVRNNTLVASAHLAGRARPDLVRMLLALEDLRRELKRALGLTGRSALSSEPRLDALTCLVPEAGKNPCEALAMVEQRLYRLRQELRAMEDEIASGARILATTLARACVRELVFNRPWDTVILDEASMASLPQVFFASALARRHFIILGDFRQLAPIAQADAPVVREWLTRDVFAHLGITGAVDEGRSHPYLVLLPEQRRMHPSIADFCSKAVYGGLLTSASGMARRREGITGSDPFPGRALAVVDLSALPSAVYKSGSSRINPMSALVTVTQAAIALAAGQRSVALITPYVAQARLLRALAHELYPAWSRSEDQESCLYVATVHRFQGSERDVVFLDLVEGYPLKAPGRLLTDVAGDGVRRLINVALTRARGKCVVVAHAAYLESRLSRGNIIRRLFNHVKDAGGFYPAAGFLPFVDASSQTGLPAETEALTWHKDPASALERWLADCRLAEGRLVLDLPTGGAPPREWITAIRRLAGEGRPLTLRCPDPQMLPAGLRPFAQPHPWCWTAATVVDGRILWLGAPWLDHAAQNEWCACRLAAEQVLRQITAILRVSNRLRGRKHYKNVKY
ncbi:MAG: DEAD/DEAH box helicase [Bacillota bacterium]